MDKRILIERYVYECQKQFNSYPMFSQLKTPHSHLMNAAYFSIAQISSNNEVKTQVYPEMNGFNKKVVYVKVALPIIYKGSKFSVYSKVVFPPNFPMVPPIFSVINVNPQTFDVNKLFINYVLPDESYEVKLLGSLHWIKGFDFKSLLKEFMDTLGQNFPFFKRRHGYNPNVPKRVYYDPRYNDLGTKFPFDYDLVNISSMSNQTNYNNYNQNNNNRDQPYNQNNNHQSNYNQNNNHQSNYNQNNNHGSKYNQNNNNRDQSYNQNTYNPNNNNYQREQNKNQYKDERPIRNTLNIMKDSITSDLNSYEKNLDFLIQKKDELQIKTNQIKKQHDLLLAAKSLLEKECPKLENEYKKYNEKELDDKTIEKLIDFNDEKQKKLFILQNDLKGNLDCQLFLVDGYLEEELGEYKDVVHEMNKLWSEEFDIKLKKVFIQQTSLNY